MDKLITYKDFIKNKTPFSSFHRIYFKKDSEAYATFGDFVYGKFMRYSFSRKTESLKEADRYIGIDAPKVSGYNQDVPDTLRIALYFKGVHFSDVDISRTYGMSEN